MFCFFTLQTVLWLCVSYSDETSKNSRRRGVNSALQPSSSMLLLLKLICACFATSSVNCFIALGWAVLLGTAPCSKHPTSRNKILWKWMVLWHGLYIVLIVKRHAHTEILCQTEKSKKPSIFSILIFIITIMFVTKILKCVASILKWKNGKELALRVT